MPLSNEIFNFSRLGSVGSGTPGDLKNPLGVRV